MRQSERHCLTLLGTERLSLVGPPNPNGMDEVNGFHLLVKQHPLVPSSMRRGLPDLSAQRVVYDPTGR